MADQGSRSEEVIESYKQHKLAASALQEIHRLLQEFERARRDDRRIAVVGMLLLLGLVVAAYFYFGGGETITIS